MLPEKDHNLDYGSVYRKPVALPSWDTAKFVAMMVAGASGWVMVGLLIRWFLKN